MTHVPPGWDSWLGLVGNSQYYNYAVSDNGVKVQHGSDYATDYFTDVVANRSYSFLANTTRDYPNQPWFMYVCNTPTTPPSPPHIHTIATMQPSSAVIVTPRWGGFVGVDAC